MDFSGAEITGINQYIPETAVGANKPLGSYKECRCRKMGIPCRAERTDGDYCNYCATECQGDLPFP